MCLFFSISYNLCYIYIYIYIYIFNSRWKYVPFLLERKATLQTWLETVCELTHESTLYDRGCSIQESNFIYSELLNFLNDAEE